MNFEENLALLLIGSIISTVFVFLFTYVLKKREKNIEYERLQHRKHMDIEREDHQFESKIKKELVIDISTSVSIFVKQMSLRFKELNEKERIEHYYEWRRTTPKIRGTLIVYFVGQEIVKDWDNLYRAITNFYLIFENMLNTDNEKTKCLMILLHFLETMNVLNVILLKRVIKKSCTNI